jgi:hypothetical protein
MLKNMLRAYIAISTVFSKPITPLFTFAGLIFLRIIVSAGMLLDYLFFPSINKQKIISPIIVVGNPRSGTTFLQRFLVNQNIGVGLKLWKMLFPSLTLQFFFKPLLSYLEKISPARFHHHAAHETSLTAIETDDPSLMFHYFDGFFVYGFFLSWAKEDLISDFDPILHNTSQRDFNWLEQIWKRNLIGEKHNREIAKLFSLGVRIPAFLEYYPDAKILYMLRDPLETVPSGLSLITGVLDGRFGFWNLSESKRTLFIERLYAAFLELSMRFHNDYISSKIDLNKIKIIRYDRMMNDFENLMQELIPFLEITPTDELINEIKRTSEKQSNFKSSHKYSLEKFGLDEYRIRKDYEKIYSTFFS